MRNGSGDFHGYGCHNKVIKYNVTGYRYKYGIQKRTEQFPSLPPWSALTWSPNRLENDYMRVRRWPGYWKVQEIKNQQHKLNKRHRSIGVKSINSVIWPLVQSLALLLPSSVALSKLFTFPICYFFHPAHSTVVRIKLSNISKKSLRNLALVNVLKVSCHY